MQARGFADADDIASVLHARVARATARAGSGRTRKPSRLIVGLIPEAQGSLSPDMRHALTERRELIESRADAVLDAAVDAGEPWARALGAPPRDEKRRKTERTWRRRARVIAAYRDRYGLTDDTPLGTPPGTEAQRIDRARAAAALAWLRDQARTPHDDRLASQQSITAERDGLTL